MRVVLDKDDLQTLQDGFCVKKLFNGKIITILLHKNTQKHYHSAGTKVNRDIDSCALCGADIRDEIHIRD